MATLTKSELAALASKQHGLMTHAQATSAGYSRTALSRLVHTGVWEIVRPRVFRRAAASQTEQQALMALCLWLGEGAVVSHRSAARLLGLDLEKGDFELTTLPKFSGALEGVVVHRSKAMHEDDRKKLRGIPVTTGARTIVDLASCLTEEQLAIAVEEAWRKKIATPDWVWRRFKELSSQGRKTGALREILLDCDGRKEPLESALEVVVWRLLKRNRLEPTPNYEFRDDFGQPGHVDFAFPDQQLAIECDGWEFHSTRKAFEDDRLRAARLAAVGWRVMPLTWKQVHEEPEKVVDRIRHALKFRRQKI